MIVNTFGDDFFELEDFCKRLEKFIDTEHHFVDGGLVLALSSKYGSGKTTFLNMWRSAKIATDNKKRMVVSLNAWESDYIGDPLFSIISALTHTFDIAGKDVRKVTEAAKDIGWFVTAVGSQVATKLTGINAIEAGEFAGKKNKERQNLSSVPDAFSEFEKRKAAMFSLKKAIQELIGSDTPSVLFLVDELDRCRPDYAITYLETIKHMFDISGAVFILAADRKQLENSAKTAFGRNLDFEEYYRKFIHREITLPEISARGYRKLAEEYVKQYLVQGDRFSLLTINDTHINNISGLIASLKMTPRQIQEVFRVLGHLCETPNQNAGKLHWCIGFGSLAMCVFKVGAPEIFHKIGKKEFEPAEAISFLTTLDHGHVYWWFAIFFSGDGLNVPEDTKFNDLVQSTSLNNNELEINDFYSGWGYGSKNRFSQIYEKIQEIDQWK